MVKGRTWKIFWVLVGLGISVFIPVGALMTAGDWILTAVLPDVPVLSTVFSDMLTMTGAFFFLLALICLYGKLVKAKKDGPMEVVPEEM